MKIPNLLEMAMTRPGNIFFKSSKNRLCVDCPDSLHFRAKCPIEKLN